MPADEALRSQTDRLASLLADARGAEILGELQLAALRLKEIDGSPTPHDGAENMFGVWRLERQGDSGRLYRVDDGFEAKFWADVAEIELAEDARRVVLIGESVARGWIYDPDFCPAMALQRNLEAVEPGAHQVIDLAKAGAHPEELTALVGRLPALRPDCVILLAGNNWAGLPVTPTPEMLQSLGDAVRRDGYAGLRHAYRCAVMTPRIGALLDSLAALHREQGTQVVVVVPEFNLQGWAPPDYVDVPAMSSENLEQWYALREQAESAMQEERWTDVLSLAARLRDIDDGMSPLPGTLVARASRHLGDAAGARRGLEQRRDALVGVGIPVTPRASAEIQELLMDFAAEHDFPAVDLRTVLADGPLGLPDRLSFLDYCHMSDEAIERAMAPVTDAVLGRPHGTTAPGPGAPAATNAVVRVIVAAQCAYFGQPMEEVTPQLRAALTADPDVEPFMSALLDLLESQGPLWAHPALETLAQVRTAREVLGPMLLSSMRSERMWVLWACLAEVLGRTPPPGPREVDLLTTADKMDRLRPDCAPRRAFRQVTAERSTLAFALHEQIAGEAVLTYRTPSAEPGRCVRISVNGAEVALLESCTSWTSSRIVIPSSATHGGINWIGIRWPLPVIDVERSRAVDAATLCRGGFPDVVPVFGELFEARISFTDGDRAS